MQKSENIIWPGQTTHFGQRKPIQTNLGEEHLYHGIYLAEQMQTQRSKFNNIIYKSIIKFIEWLINNLWIKKCMVMVLKVFNLLK